MKTNTKIISICSFIFMFAICLTFITGCGSVRDGDYEPVSVQGHHPFESTEMHGMYVSASIDKLNECTECHGEDLDGINNGVISSNGKKDRSCYKCHNSDNHPVEFSGDSTDHTGYFQTNNWNMKSCYTCHSNTEAEDVLSLGGSCNSGQCHSTSSIGPQACNTCHGNPDADPENPVNWAPPGDLEGQEDIGQPGVGVHRTHLVGKTGTAKLVRCETCHVVPKTWDENGHISDNTEGIAEVEFHFPATRGGMNPVYNREGRTCSDVHCHGGNEAIWTSQGNWEDCTSCHGMPPSGMHPLWPSLNQCYICHGAVIDVNGEIINPNSHVNGIVND